MKKIVMVFVGLATAMGVAVAALAADQAAPDNAAIIKEATATLKKNPKDLSARVARSDAALNEREFEMAIEDYTVLIDKAPTALTYFKRGQAYAETGQTDKAIADFSGSLKLDPKSLYAYFFRGGMHVKNGQYRKAIADYDEAIKLSSTNIWFFNNRGEAYFMLGDYDSAIRDWKKAMAMGFDKDYLSGRIAEAESKKK